MRGALGRPKQAVATKAVVARVADEGDGDQEDYAADGARLALQEKADQVQGHEHDVRLQQRWIHRLRNQQHGDQPLKTVHPGGTK